MGLIDGHVPDGVVCIPPDMVPAYQAQGMHVLGKCDCGEDHGGEVPKLADGGPVTNAVFNRFTQPAWEIAKRTVPEAILPTIAGATIADGLLED